MKRFTLTTRVLAKLRRAVRSPMCARCRERHGRGTVDFYLCLVRAERRRQQRYAEVQAGLISRASTPYHALAEEPGFQVSYERYAKRAAAQIASALDLEFEQADGCRTLSGDDLAESGFIAIPPARARAAIAHPSRALGREVGCHGA